MRLQVARAIYRDPVLSRYAMGAVPSIHIIVDNGKVTLTGVVNNTMEKQVAGMRASVRRFELWTGNQQPHRRKPAREERLIRPTTH